MCWKGCGSEGMQIKKGSVRSLWKVGLGRISCHNFILVDGCAYFSNWFYNGLFKTEIQTGETFFLGCFEGETLSEVNLHWELFLRDGRIYFLPKRGRHMHIYTLSDGSMERTEIRGSSEGFFRIREVILGDGCAAFIPEEDGHPARKADLATFRVAYLDSREDVQGERLIQRRDQDRFPASVLITDHHVEGAGGVSWKRLPEGCWCGFLPMGRHLLRYFEGSGELHATPLAVVNGEELEQHLQKVQESFLQSFFGEERMGLPMFLDMAIRRKPAGTGDAAGGGTGNGIWGNIRERPGWQ